MTNQNAVRNTLAMVAGLTAVLTGVWTPTSSALQQSGEDVRSQIAGILTGFDDPDWRNREQAFYELLNLVEPGRRSLALGLWALEPAFDAFFKKYPDLKDQVVFGLIDLLDRETIVHRNAALGSLPEEFGAYEGDLIAAIRSLNDPRGADALVAELGTGGMAGAAVAARGAREIDRVLAVLGTGDIAARIGATHTLGLMLDPTITTLDVQTRTKVKAGLLQASRDSHFAVRLAALDGLARLPDADVTAALQAMRDADPYRRLDGTYPVRDRARRVLAAR